MALMDKASSNWLRLQQSSQGWGQTSPHTNGKGLVSRITSQAFLNLRRFSRPIHSGILFLAGQATLHGEGLFSRTGLCALQSPVVLPKVLWQETLVKGSGLPIDHPELLTFS
jgi:hypothetical protein